MLVVASPDNSLLWTVFLNQKCAMVSDSALSITEVVLSVVYCLSRIWRFLRFFFFKVIIIIIILHFAFDVGQKIKTCSLLCFHGYFFHHV